MNAEMQDLIKTIAVQDLVQLSFNENVIKSNFQTIITILLSLQSDVKSCNSQILNVEQIQSQMITSIDNLEHDTKFLKQAEKEIQNSILQHSNQIEALQKDTQQNSANIEKNILEIENNNTNIQQLQNLEVKDRADIDYLLNQMNDLENTIQGLQGQMELLNQMKSDLEKCIENNSLLQYQLDQIKEAQGIKVPSLKSMGSISNIKNNQGNENNGNNELLEGILKELANLKNLKLKFVTKEEQEKINKQLQDQITKLQKQLNLSNENFEKLQQYLYTNLNGGKQLSMEELQQLGLSSTNLNKDNAELDEIRERLDDFNIFRQEVLKNASEISDMLDNLRQDLDKVTLELNNHLYTYDGEKKIVDNRLEELEKFTLQCVKSDEFKRLKQEYKVVRDQTEINTEKNNQIEKQVNDLKGLINQLNKRLNDLSENPGNQQNNFNNYNEDIINNNDSNNEANSQQFYQLIENLRNEFINMMNQLKDLVNRKADKDDLFALEQMLLRKIDEMNMYLLQKINQAANGQETNRRLLELEKHVTHILNVFKSQQEGEDGLIVKRQLKWSCISCDKSLDKFKGKLGNYTTWAVFPPKETSPQKMGRYGNQYVRVQEQKKVNQHLQNLMIQQQEKLNPSTQNSEQKKILPNLSANGSRQKINAPKQILKA